MPGANQAGHEVTADVPRRPNHHDAPHISRLQRWHLLFAADAPARPDIVERRTLIAE
jgi:hypothetical protein